MEWLRSPRTVSAEQRPEAEALRAPLTARLIRPSLGGMPIVKKPATVVAAIFLSLVSLLQLLRAVAGVRVVVGDTVIPMWVSLVAFVVAGALAVGLWRERR
jgi:hypothetical protein